jgi:GH15 family glucan-1,4-alpha-glucosidase
MAGGLSRTRLFRELKNRRQLRLFLLGIPTGAIFGGLLLLFARVIRAVLRQPYFVSRAVFKVVGGQERLEDLAFHIAKDNLTAGIEKRRLANGEEKRVLVAGVRNFREPWARDFGFASFGLLAIDEIKAARECLEVFLYYQKDDGQFPVKIHSTGIPSRYLHSLLRREQPITAPLRPKYISGHNTISLDGTGLLVIAALNYIETTGDEDFAQEYWLALKKAVNWLERFALTEDGLLHQGGYSDWADSINRQGRVLYTNVIYWKALKEMAAAARIYGNPGDRNYFKARSEMVKHSILDHFWREDLGYFVTNYLFDNLNSSGNLMAIAWDLVPDGQATLILDVMQSHGMANPVPTKPVHRPYPRRYIAFENRFGGIGHYHTNAAWLWLGAWHVVALAHIGQLEQARQHLDRMADVIVKDGQVHEVYGDDGKYLSSFWYTSEAPLTWSAGLFVYAYKYLQERQPEMGPE